MKCEECGTELEEKFVCKGCGLVVEEVMFDKLPIQGYTEKDKDRTTYREWEGPLAPNIRYSHRFPKRPTNPALRRSFNIQRRQEKKDKAHKYMVAFLEIKKCCSFLRLPNNVTNEVINIYRCVNEKETDFFKKHGRRPSFLAFIKIACRIHEYPMRNSQLIELVDYKLSGKRTTAYMDKKFNKAFMMTIKLLGIKFKTPEHPKFIDYACVNLFLPYGCAKMVHNIYRHYKHVFKPEYKLEGYILALYYILFKKNHRITLDHLEDIFEVSRITIGNRRKELLKVLK